MKFFKIVKPSILCFIILVLLGCSDDFEYKADQISGYWKAVQITEVVKNGEGSTNYEKRFFARFFDNNCGILYDSNENKTNDFKWALHEHNTGDKLLLSTSLNSNSQNSSFSIHTLYTLSKISKNRFEIYYTEKDTLNGEVFERTHRIYFSRK